MHLDTRSMVSAICRLALLILPAAAMLAACSERPDARNASDARASDGGERSAAATAASQSETGAPSRVTLSAAAYATAGITLDTVRLTSAAAPGGGLDVPAEITFDPARVALISPRAAGRIERLGVVEGDHVRAGEPVAYLSSPEFLTAETDFVQAKRRAAQLAGTPDAEGTSALAAAARRRLELLGVPDEVIVRLEGGAEPSFLLPVTAPFSGSIVEGMTLAGAAVQPGTPLFRIADLSVVDAIAQLPERALSIVHEGQDATVSVAAFPDLRAPGRVTSIQSELDSATRTIRVVVRVPNPGRRLRSGMFATVRLKVPAGAIAGSASSSSSGAAGGRGIITIPESAVIAQGSQRYVFVEVAPRTFERREVEVVPFAPPGDTGAPGGQMVVHGGISAGMVLVVKGAFTLQSELAKSQFGESEG